jgi:hypothetical protein
MKVRRVSARTGTDIGGFGVSTSPRRVKTRPTGLPAARFAVGAAVLAVAVGTGLFILADSGSSNSTLTADGGGSPATAGHAPDVPEDGYYLTVDAVRDAPVDRLERIAEGLRKRGYDAARVEPFPGVNVFCPGLDYEAEPTGCTISGAPPGGHIVVVEGPFTHPPTRDERAEWYAKTRSERIEEAARRGVEHPLYLSYLRFSQLTDAETVRPGITELP